MLAESCDGHVSMIMVDGVPTYHMDCQGDCINAVCDDAAVWEPELHWVCMCDDDDPAGYCLAQHWTVAEGGYYDFDNLRCVRSGCAVDCTKIPEDDVPESPSYTSLCSCSQTY
jgi:hypothetical protein